MTDDVTWPQKVNVVTQITLKLNISITVRNGWIATKLAHDGPHMGLHPRYAQGQGQGQRSRDTDTFVILGERTSIMVKPGNCPWQLQLSSYSFVFFSFKTKFIGQTRNLYRYGPQVDLRTPTQFQWPWPTFQGHRPIFVPKTRNFKSI